MKYSFLIQFFPVTLCILCLSGQIIESLCPSVHLWQGCVSVTCQCPSNDITRNLSTHVNTHSCKNLNKINSSEHVSNERVPLLPNSRIWYQCKLGGKQAHHTTHCSWCYSFGWCLSEDQEIRDQHHPIIPHSLGRTLPLLFSIILS